MNSLQITINGHQHNVTIKEYRDQRVVTFKEVDELHQRPEFTASRNFGENKKHFIEREDYFYLTSAEIQSTKIVDYTSPKGLILLTESGYLMLVKSFTDDLAWQVQRQLVNGYFRAKNQSIIPSSTTQALLQAVQILAQQEQQLKLLEATTTRLSHRLDNIDSLDTIGDLQQRLNAMVRRLAQQEGLSFPGAWKSFKQSFNVAFHTNITMLVENYKMKHGLSKITVPQYLSLTGKLEDAIRVADKLLNRAS